jgi:micrococcal nuclease
MTRARNRPELTRRQRRLRYAARKASRVAVALIVVAAFIAADRLGAFGRVVDRDFERYDGYGVRVVKVVDGDTLDIDLPDRLRGRRHTRVRLWGVDTPETVKPNTPVQHYGREAGEFVRKTCLGRHVTLELEQDGRTRGVYGRLLAFVHLRDGRMLNRVLVAQGYGYADPRFAHRYLAEFARLQRKARKARLGLWEKVRPADIPTYLRDRIRLGEP